jgi:predicted O-linked N-acetylglucosamine transferase (SPINDLY family)
MEALQRGFQAFQAGDVGKAEAAFRKVLSKDERQFDALHMLAVINAQRGNYPEGIRLMGRALAVNPAFAEAHVNLGRMQAETRDFDAAAESYHRALSLNPRLPVAHSNFSAVLRNLGFRAEALSHSETALRLASNYADAWYNRGRILLDMHRFDDARASYEKALALDPANVDAATGLALALHLSGRYADAVSCLDRVLQARPSQPYAADLRLHSKMLICEWSGHAVEVERLVSQVRKAPSVATPFSFVAVSSAAADQFKCAADFVNDKFPASVSPLAAGRIYGHDKIRLAYLSGDFHDHPVAHLMAGVFERHDRSRFEVTAVSFGPDSADDMRKRLAGAFDRFIDVHARNDQAVAATLRDLEIDIAVDLNVFTNYCRPGILGRRPAPVQVNYLGYSGTAGVPHFDYLIADRTIIPAADQPFFSEKIVYLPDTYLPSDDRRPCPTSGSTRQDEGLPERGVVFCAFNGAYKFTPAVFDVWMRLLRQIDGSVLWVRSSNKEATENLRREAERRGVPANRIVFAKHAAAMEAHLARHRLADLFLDTLPYNAHTTASDALWMGLPLVTCVGTTFAGRVAASLLRTAGLPDLIAASLDEYEQMALKLARDPALLQSFRLRVEAARHGSPLFDTVRFTRHIEAAYVQMWERLQRGEPPAAFAVEALGA